MSEERPSGALNETFLRTDGAARLAELDDGLRDLVSSFIEDVAERAALEVRMDADFRGVRIGAHAPSSHFGDAVFEYIASHAASQETVSRLKAMYRRIEPAEMGSWLYARESQLDWGWVFKGPMSLDVARAWGPEHRASGNLGKWAAEQGVDTCTSLAVSGVTGEVSLQIPLPGEDLQGQLESLATTPQVLGRPVPPALVDVFGTESPEAFAFTLTMAEADPEIGFSLDAVEPPLSLALLASSMAGLENDAHLAALQAMLDQEAPMCVHVELAYAGTLLSFTYESGLS